MEFYNLRNEQACSYAASAHGYLTGRPAVLVVVPGPGVSDTSHRYEAHVGQVVHALAGMENSVDSNPTTRCEEADPAVDEEWVALASGWRREPYLPPQPRRFPGDGPDCRDEAFLQTLAHSPNDPRYPALHRADLSGFLLWQTRRYLP